MSLVETERYILDTRGWEYCFGMFYSNEVRAARCVICDEEYETTPPLSIRMISGVLCDYDDVCPTCAPSCAPVMASLVDIFHGRGDLRSHVR
jgi:hypothetical protein